jgi:hypothetical protein
VTKLIPHLAGLVLGLMFLSGCETVPVTGRTQLSLAPASTMASIGLDYYRDFMSKHKVTADADDLESVRRVSGRIQQAVTLYFQQRDEMERLEGFRKE